MPRRIRDSRHADVRFFTREATLLRRECAALLETLAPDDVAAQETTIIHTEAEQAVVRAYLVAKTRDEKHGVTTHLAAFFRDRQRAKILKRVMSRIPSASAVVNG